MAGIGRRGIFGGLLVGVPSVADAGTRASPMLAIIQKDTPGIDALRRTVAVQSLTELQAETRRLSHTVEDILKRRELATKQSDKRESPGVTPELSAGLARLQAGQRRLERVAVECAAVARESRRRLGAG